jgi:hypothetical protein
MNHITRPSHVIQDHIARAAAHLTDRDRQIALDCHEHGWAEAPPRSTGCSTKSAPASPPPNSAATATNSAGAAATPLKVARSATLAHHIAVNKFFARLAVEARAAGGALREWHGERTTQGLLDGIAAPDGYGVITLPDRDPLHLLLQLDRGTEPLSRIRDKVDRYAKALPRSELADADPLVLFVVPSQRRASGIMRTVGAAPIGRVAAAWEPDERMHVLALFGEARRTTAGCP